jgi:cytochrome c-type biogenesis protein CcsB
MRELIHRFASLRVTVVLIVLVLLALATGTIVESLHGAPAAGRLVYQAPWFRALLAVFSLNLTASLVALWPWGQRRIGYALTHGSMLVILAGGVATELRKVEGQLQIWEGEESRAVVGGVEPGSTAEPKTVATLPFAVRLDSFEVDYYEGTRRPAQFRSRVTVRDGGLEKPAVIEMNRPLEHGGYTFFQSSYRETAQRDLTVLSVAKDPGQPVVFLGYYGLVIGMLVVLGTRIAERRRAARPVAPAAGAAALLALAAIGTLAASPAAAQNVPTPAEADALRRVVVQHDGRLMPLDTLAREAVWNVTGRRSVWGQDPVQTFLGWSFDASGWSVQPVVPVKDRALARAIGLAPGTSWTSFQALASNQALMDLLQRARLLEEQEKPLTGVEKAASKLETRLLWMQQTFEESMLRIVPAGRAGEAWGTPDHAHSAADLRAAADAAAGAAAARLPAWKVDRELTYNRARPARTAWIVLALALVLSIAAWNVPGRGLDLAAFLALLGGFAVMSWGIWLRWTVAGRIPASNMYESLLFLAWGVGAFAIVASVFLRNRIVVLNAAAMSALTMALTDLLPIDAFIHPMPPVLSGTYWLAVHVPIIMVGYSVLALGVVVAHMQLGFQAFAPSRRSTVLAMADLLYWYTMAGSILLVTGIITGSMWAAESWGRYWGWDPKEVWSLVAFLAYMAILHARAERLIGLFGVAAWSIVAFQTILMTYLGVNFVLASGLHSYGFGESNVVRAMVATALVEGGFIFFAWLKTRKPATA